MRDWTAHLRETFRSTAIDSDILDELAQHAESTYDELRADGASQQEALAKVDRLIDGWRTDPTALRRIVKRSVTVIPPSPTRSLASGMVADAIYGLRLMRARPGYAAITILTIALGVGAVTTLFSVAYGVVVLRES